jgi:hypothetical protein
MRPPSTVTWRAAGGGAVVAGVTAAAAVAVVDVVGVWVVVTAL